MKPCKVLHFNQHKKVGFLAQDLNHLLHQASKKFKIGLSNVRLTLEDGTDVDDEEYFSYLPDNTLFILMSKTESTSTFWATFSKLISKVWGLPKPLKDDMMEVVTNLIEDVETRHHIQNLIDQASQNLSDSRSEDPDWFEGVAKNITSKENWMAQNAKTRVRGYYIRTKDEVERSLLPSSKSRKRQAVPDEEVYQNYLDVFEKMRQELNKQYFYAGYFARRDKSLRLCNEDGCFYCQGEYNKNTCKSNHQLNPYGSRESRIIFSTWNLDHVIERSRSIIPALEEAIRNSVTRKINWRYFYKLLFVARGNKVNKQDGNLKLVHIVCHVKNSHQFICDKKKYYE